MTDRIGIYGGAFDPPHIGHVLAAHFVLLTSPVSRVLAIPCAQHAFGKDHIDFEHRWQMCRLAFQMLAPAVEVLDLEARRSGPSYMIDTVRELRQRFPAAAFDLIVGSDISDEVAKWREGERLLELVDLRVLPRLEENTAAAETQQQSPFYLPRVSSTSVRGMIRRGENPGPRLPREVLDYVRRHGLYG